MTVTSDNGKKEGEIEESNCSKAQSQNLTSEVSVSRRTLLSDQDSLGKLRNGSSALPNRMKVLKFGSASAKFKQLAQDRDRISRSLASPRGHHRFRQRVSGVLHKKIDWPSLWKLGREWIRDPMNLALSIWILTVAISGAILFLVMTGMLNNAIPKKSARNAWFEVNNQILNALFTLMCLYNHPKRFYHLFLLYRWKPDDVTRLRKIYCKNGTYKPHEGLHMMIVVILLHVNCFAQYALCGLNLGYKRSQRPAIGVALCVCLAIGAPAIAGVYCIVSPLGRDYDSETDEEAQVQVTAPENQKQDALRLKSFARKYSFATKQEAGIEETRPQWRGGILDFWDDISLAYLSLFCSFCVFGWNMDRLGFGNMYVHIATFMLFCMAPFWIFNLAAVNIDNETVREALGLVGVMLCAFGLLYGGFWRIQMRKRFNLPSYTFCFGQASASDCTMWLCCCWCSLGQEVRTGNSYEIVDDRLCRKHLDIDDKIPLSPLPREDASGPSSSPYKNVRNKSPSLSPTSKGYSDTGGQLSGAKEESPREDKDDTMTPPAPSFIERESA